MKLYNPEKDKLYTDLRKSIAETGRNAKDGPEHTRSLEIAFNKAYRGVASSWSNTCRMYARIALVFAAVEAGMAFVVSYWATKGFLVIVAVIFLRNFLAEMEESDAYRALAEEKS